MKQTVREKDIPDRLFLRQVLAAEGTPVEDADPDAGKDQAWMARFRRWLVRKLGGA